MTDWFLFGGDAPPAVSAVDEGSQYTLGVEWGVTAPDLYLRGYRFHRPADLAVTGPVTARSWAAGDGSAIPGTDATFTLDGDGWQDVLLEEPIPVPQGVPWRTGAHFPNGRYPATANYWSSGPGAAGVTDGPLIGYGQAGATENEQGSFTAGPALAFPATGSPSGTNYWVTPIVTDTVSDVRTGVASVPVGVVVDLAGAKATSADVTAPVVLAGGPGAGVKVAIGAVGVPLTLSVAVAGAPSAAAAAPVSAVLCSAWATPADVPQAVKTDLGLPNDADWTGPLLRASELLWALSGRRWYGSGCQETAVLRSDRDLWPWHQTWGACGCWAATDTWPPATVPGTRHVVQPVAPKLPRSTGVAVTSVTVGGVPLSANAYRVSASGWLERTDGGSWPVCDGTAVITYTHGSAPPAGGRDAVVTLAVELARDLHQIAGCRLPKRVRSITRQGVSMDMVDPAEFLDKGLVGLVSVDMWLRAVNPDARPQEGYVWSPDLPSAGMRTSS